MASSQSYGGTRTQRSTVLIWAGAVLVLALSLHGLDHVRRGVQPLSPEVVASANVQAVIVIGTFLILVRGHRLAARLAAVVGFGNAVGVVAAHFLPHWSVFSDSFINPASGSGVTAISIATAAFEVLASLVLGCTALVVFEPHASKRDGDASRVARTDCVAARSGLSRRRRVSS